MSRPKREKLRRLAPDGKTEYQCVRCWEKWGLEKSWHPIEDFHVSNTGHSVLNCKRCHKPDKRLHRTSDGVERPQSAADAGLSVEDFLTPNRFYQKVDPYVQREDATSLHEVNGRSIKRDHPGWRGGPK